MKVSKTRLVLYSIGLILLILASTLVARGVAMTRAWWYALGNDRQMPIRILEIPYPIPVGPPSPAGVGVDYRRWNEGIARFSIDLIMRLYGQVLKPLIPIQAPHPLTLVTTLGAVESGAVFRDDTGGGVVWIAFRGVWTVSEMLMTFNVRQLHYGDPDQTAPHRGQRPFYRADAPRTEQPVEHHVHAGMFTEYETFRVTLLTNLNEALRPPLVVVCGHSMGGALAALVYYDLTLLGFTCVLYTFAACRVVSPGLRTAIETIGPPGGLFRVVNENDVVPMLPLPVHPNTATPTEPFLYEHIGRLVLFQKSYGSLTGNHSINMYEDAFNENSRRSPHLDPSGPVAPVAPVAPLAPLEPMGLLLQT